MHPLAQGPILGAHAGDGVEGGLELVGLPGPLLALGAQLGGPLLHGGSLGHTEAVGLGGGALWHFTLLSSGGHRVFAELSEAALRVAVPDPSHLDASNSATVTSPPTTPSRAARRHRLPVGDRRLDVAGRALPEEVEHVGDDLQQRGLAGFGPFDAGVEVVYEGGVAGVDHAGSAGRIAVVGEVRIGVARPLPLV